MAQKAANCEMAQLAAFCGCKEASIKMSLSRTLSTGKKRPHTAFRHNNIVGYLFISPSSTSRIRFHGANVEIVQDTHYPWDGNIRLRINPEGPVAFHLMMRIPGWCRSYDVRINGTAVSPRMEDGYLDLSREWNSGDEIELCMEMCVFENHAHPNIRFDTSCVALQRGPIVYCIEQADQVAPVHRLVVSDDPQFTAEWQPDVLGGIVMIHGNGFAIRTDDWESEGLYRQEKPRYAPCRITAIPYFAWANRKPGEMRVWIPGKI